MSKYLSIKSKKLIFIILSAIIFLSISISKSFSEENIFIVNDVKVEGVIDINFSRDQYINKAFKKSFDMLISKILLTRDLDKISNLKLSKIKDLINSFQILEETYQKSEYKAIFKIFYNDIKLKKLFRKKNISFSQATNISAVFFPVLFINEDLQTFNENFFYKEWDKVSINNKLINFIMPLEDLDDIYKIKEMKNKIEELNITELTNKYNTKNYVFALMDYQNKQLNIYFKTNFNNNERNKNISYKLEDINDEARLKSILKEIKIQIIDIWKEENVIDLAIPLSLRVKFQHKNLQDIDKLKNVLYKISLIDDHFLDEFNINDAFFKIYYYGDPRKLKKELTKFNYQLKNDRGLWEIYIDE